MKPCLAKNCLKNTLGFLVWPMCYLIMTFMRDAPIDRSTAGNGLNFSLTCCNRKLAWQPAYFLLRANFSKVLCLSLRPDVQAAKTSQLCTHLQPHTCIIVLVMWKFFIVSEEDTKFAICNTCKAKVNCRVTAVKTLRAANLIRHLKHCHPASVRARDSLETATSQQLPLSLLSSSEKTQAIMREIMGFMALDDQLFYVLENRGFRNLINYLGPKYTRPSRRYFSAVVLQELFNLLSCHTQILLEADPKATISFTADIWTPDVSSMSVLSLAAQRVDNDFQRL